MESILRDIPNVAVYLDDILVTGPGKQEHLQNLEEVLTRLEQSGLRLKRSKYEFMGKEVVFLGHKINATGLHPLREKVEAIAGAQVPRNVSELKAYLGLLNYYHRFLPNLSTQLAPLHLLLRKDEKWLWGPEQQKALEDSKTLMQSSAVLVHYDSNKPLILACDASPCGVGAVLSHQMTDGSERPVSFVSRTLSAAEKNYSQLDKEGLAVVFGVKKFHSYLYGRHFKIVTDHKPLLSLFNEMKALPQMASPRVQRWAVTLGAYDYTIVYKRGKDHLNADALSRLPLTMERENSPEEEERVLLLDDSDTPLVNAQQLKRWTDKDPVLARVREFILRGWPQKLEDPTFTPYTKHKDELSTQEGCILWGGRVVIPLQGRAALLKQLHQTHPGITRMKGLARSYMWWPNLDAEVESLVNACAVCQEHRNSPALAPLHPWEVPDKPWRRVHVDYAGPWMGKMFLILVDAYSKWIDAHVVNRSTSAVTIECLRQSFSQQGIPEIVVSDNGTCFTSAEFREFMQKNGIRHITTAPYHPASNGLAERAVQTVKSLIKKKHWRFP
uniref:Gypsy retrotransposon integrase-like protein 1 n=1 Tax=Paramormyrops kingsleyae TaxID=1676925 RepID=A0A3B3SKQ2_9TELE